MPKAMLSAANIDGFTSTGVPVTFAIIFTTISKGHVTKCATRPQNIEE